MFSTQSSNPVLQSDQFKMARSQDGNVMTVDGTVNKTALLLLITILSSAYSWQSLTPTTGLFLISGIGGLALYFITAYKPTIAHITAPLYCGVKGLLLGSFSAFAESLYPGIVVNAIILTLGLLGVMLSAYKSGYIRATPKLQRMIGFGMIAYLVLAGVHMISWIFGLGLPSLFYGGPIAIAFSLFAVGLGSLFLVLDFDEIESGAREGKPKQYEWMGAFGLIVTLIWIYWEVLRLLINLQQSND